MKSSNLLLFLIFSVFLTIAGSVAGQNHQQSHGHSAPDEQSFEGPLSNQSTDVWTQTDWDVWLADLEAAYDSGMSAEMLYWWIETQLAALESAEPSLSIDLPEPYPGWGGGADPTPPGGPIEPQSSRGSKATILAPPCNPNAPGGCEAPVIVNPGIVDFADPATIQEIRLFGAVLALAGSLGGHKPTTVVGATLVVVAEGLELWVLESDDEDE